MLHNVFVPHQVVYCDGRVAMATAISPEDMDVAPESNYMCF